MAKKISNQIVKKSNALVRCRWTIEHVWEPRLVALLASKIHVNDQDFQVYEVPLSEIMGKDYSGRDVKQLADVVDRVMSRVVTVYDGDGKGWAKYNVFFRCRYKPRKGVLELGIHPDLKPHYLNLKERFTQYDLTEFMSLPSIYSQRIYEILKSWYDKPEVEITIEELYEMLDISASYRSDFGQFRRRILEQAHKDIVDREGSTLWYDWEPIKSGRAGKVVAVRFVFDWKKAQEMKKNQPSDEMLVHQALQRESNRCFERVVIKARKKCTPKPKTPRCKFCLERGRMFAQSIAQQGKLFDESANSPSTA